MNCPPPTWVREVMENTAATNENRIDQFKVEVSEMQIRTGNAGRESIYQIIGFVMMIAGIVIAFLTWNTALAVEETIEVNTQIVGALTGLTVTVAGAALFLRYSLAKFLRMWLLRQMYEGQANADRISDALARRES